jgi:hypothetical protein
VNQNLVSLEQAQRHLRCDQDQIGQPDPDLEAKIAGASAAVLEYLKSAADEFTDSSGEVLTDSSGTPLGIPAQVRSATLILIGYLNLVRDEDTESAFRPGFLPAPVQALLYPLRRPTLA